MAELRQVYRAVKGPHYAYSTFHRRFQRMQSDGVIVQAPGNRWTGGRAAKVFRFKKN